MDANIKLNVEQAQQNFEQCIKTTRGWEGIAYTNICDGSKHFVPNGALDKLCFIGMVLVILLLVIQLFKTLFD